MTKEVIKVNIAVDLETLDVRPSAIVLSAGLVAFTKFGGVVGTYYTEFGREEQTAAERTTNPATLAWWESQSPFAKRVLTSTGVPVPEALTAINMFFSRFDSGPYEVEGVWGYGSDFDNVILKSLYDSFAMPVPWTYKQNRCGRTLIAHTGVAAPETQEKHDALNDALWLANSVRRCMAPQLF